MSTSESSTIRNCLMHDHQAERWQCIELPVTGYREAWQLQNNIVAARKDKIVNNNVILLLEHPPVFTTGRKGGVENLTVPSSFLGKAGISVVQVERGGDITFHGPGQIVMYPIIHLQDAKLGVVDYVEKLEEVMIRAAADWGIKAERNQINRGVWVGNNKLGSVGIAIRRGISFHGMAFNVNISLKPFGWIKPCGLENVGITSIKREISRKVSMSQVRENLKLHLKSIFGIELVMTSLQKMKI